MQQARKFLSFLIIGVVVLNLGLSFFEAIGHSLNRKSIPLHSLSYQFHGLEPLFQGLSYAGYLSDKDMEVPAAIAQYELAQYVLAPAVLALNKADYPLIILDYSTPEAAVAKIKELGLQPLKGNNGLILALNPKAVKQ